MGKQVWKAGNMVYPLPAVMVSTADKSGKSNILTIAWTGTICTNPAMVYISVRPERYSYHMLKESGEFVINLTTEQLAKATDYCGVRSGKDVDKWKEAHLTPAKAEKLQYAPVIEECPVNIECKVTEVKKLGSHHMFLAEVLAVQIDEQYLNEKNKFELNKTGLMAYSHGEYLSLGKKIGTFGYSVKKKKTKHKKKKKSEPSELLSYVKGLEHSCFVCDKIESTFQNYLGTIFYLYKKEEFRKLFQSSKGFCTKHYGMLYEMAPERLRGELLESFITELNRMYLENMKRVHEDLSWFIDKFDYRFKDEPWKNAKDALPRTMTKLNSIL